MNTSIAITILEITLQPDVKPHTADALVRIAIKLLKEDGELSNYDQRVHPSQR